MPSPTVSSYYDAWESRLGYRLMLGGTRHFGYYEHDTWWPFPLQRAMRSMEEKMFSIIDVSKGRVLDAGCGNGNVAIYMAKKGLKIQAIDLLARHVDRAKKNVKSEGLEGSVEVSKMSYQDLSFESNSFDGVYTMETLSHASDFYQAIKELHRVLKPGGHLTLFEYEHDQLKPGRALDAITKVNKASSMTAFQNLTSGTIAKKLEMVGFKDIEVRDYSQNIAPMMRLFFLLAYLPYMIVCFFGVEGRFPNAMAAVELWRYGEHIQYLAISARKEE